MHQLPKFENLDYPSHVCKLCKLLYGLKQAPRAWFSKLSLNLLALNFHASNSDSSLFICYNSSVSVYVLVYGDDIIVTSSIASFIFDFLCALSTSFPIKDLGSLHYFLGIEVFWNSHGLF